MRRGSLLLVLGTLAGWGQASAVLSVEPDLEKHRVRISGESKDLQTALTYLQKLQGSHSLQNPMLDSHEVIADNNEHPVRFAMTADWREQP